MSSKKVEQVINMQFNRTIHVLLVFCEFSVEPR